MNVDAVLAYIGGWSVAGIICLVVGLALMIAEMFTPGMGLMGALGICSIIAAIILRADTLENGLITLAIILVLLFVAGIIVYRSFQKGRIANSAIILKESIDSGSTSLSNSDMQAMIGRIGIATTALRPSGIADFDGIRLDVLSDGEFIKKGDRVKVQRVEGLKIIVKPYTEEN